MSYSRAHYRRVSPPPDTAVEERDRLIRQIASERAIADRMERFPRLTPENADAAIDFQLACEVEHRKALTSELPMSRRAVRVGRPRPLGRRRRMPRYLYRVKARATIEEVWAIDSDVPLDDAVAMEAIDAGRATFVSDVVIGEEEDRQFWTFDGEAK